MILKNYTDFINESVVNINWKKVENFIKNIKLDFQFDDTHEDFFGFINLDPSDEDFFGASSGIYEFMKASEKDDSNYSKLLSMLSDNGLSMPEPPSKNELILSEKEGIYSSMSPENYLKSRGCVETDDGWNCDFILRLTNGRTPLIQKGKFVVNINKAKGILANTCNLTTLEGAPKQVDSYVELSIGNYINPFMLKFYENNVKEGIQDFWLEFLKHIITKYPNQLDNIEWPEGFLNDNLKASAKTLGKFNL